MSDQCRDEYQAVLTRIGEDVYVTPYSTCVVDGATGKAPLVIDCQPGTPLLRVSCKIEVEDDLVQALYVALGDIEYECNRLRQIIERTGGG